MVVSAVEEDAEAHKLPVYREMVVQEESQEKHKKLFEGLKFFLKSEVHQVSGPVLHHPKFCREYVL